MPSSITLSLIEEKVSDSALSSIFPLDADLNAFSLIFM